MSIEETEKWENVSYRMDAEGFHYCFQSYSNFEEIEDEEFHELRKEYLLISDKLEKYVKNKLDEEIDFE